MNMEHGTNFRAPYLFLLYINKYFTKSHRANSPPVSGGESWVLDEL